MRCFATIFVVLASVSMATPAMAQVNDPLFDTFNFKLEGSRIRTNTTIRLDSENLGQGSTISFEDDLALREKNSSPLSHSSGRWAVGTASGFAGRR